MTTQTPLEGLNPATDAVLQRFSRRRRWLLWMRGLAVAVIAVLLMMAVVALADYFFLLSEPIRFGLTMTGYIVAAAAVWWTSLRFLGVDSRFEVAKQLESADPNLREDLLSAVELADPESANGSLRFRDRLQQLVARRVVGVDVRKLLPIGILKPWLTGAAALVALVIGLLLVPQLQMGRRMARALLPGIPIERASLIQVSIVKPSPPSRFVAEGDAVGVIVDVSGRWGISGRATRQDDVTLQYYAEDSGGSRWSKAAVIEATMSQRSEGFRDSESAGPEDDLDDSSTIQFAANIPVGSSTVRYRVLAGDAITLWHALTPLPRPEVVEFNKEYVFPKYSRLPNRSETSEHGDLRALVGTTAIVTVTFDQPVKDAKIKYGNRGTEYSLNSVNESDRTFQTNIRMTTPGQYQIDATGIESKLSNPFGPQYSIVPQVDTPPIARWDESIKRTQIVSPLEVIELAGTVTDDLPIEQVSQDIEINGGKPVSLNLNVVVADRDLDFSWDWDLMKPNEISEESRQQEEQASEQEDEKVVASLKSGDVVRTRLVAVDRAGNRVESDVIELLVADEGMASDRHDRMERATASLGKIATWADQVQNLLEAAEKPTEKAETESVGATISKLQTLIDNTDEPLKSLRYEIARAGNLAEAGNLELIGREIIQLREQTSGWMKRVSWLNEDNSKAWDRERLKLLREEASQAKRTSQVASRLAEFARYQAAHQVTLAAASDQLLLQSSLQPLFNSESPMAIERFPRYLNVAAGRMLELAELVERNAYALPESTVKQLERWQSWNVRWADQLQSLPKEQLSEDQIRGRMAQFANELKQQIRNGILDGKISSKLAGANRDVRKDVQAICESVFQMRRAGVDSDKASEGAENEKDSDKATVKRMRSEFANLDFDNHFRTVMSKLDEEEALHRARPSVDLRYAADMNLMKQAMRAIAGEGFRATGEESAADVHDKVGKAFRMIEAAHDVEILRREAIELAADEVELGEDAATRLDHGVRIERYGSAMEHPGRELQNSGLSWQVVRLIEETRYNSDFSKARDRITKRRWSDDELLSATDSLRLMVENVDAGLAKIEPNVIEARQTILQYVPTIPELARKAAEETDAAKSDASETASEQVEQTEEAVEAAMETVEALNDFSNTAEMTDQEQRELSRDADTAAEMITQAAREAKAQTSEQPQSDLADASLEKLSERLRETAEHFERAEKGEDVSESREKLRQAEEELGIQRDLEDRFERTESVAEATQKDPRELLKQLEQELQQNKPMQEELEKISDRTAESVQRDLEQMARDEKSIGQTLERSDPQVMEQKILAARELRLLSRQTSVVEQAMLGTAARANQWGNQNAAKEEMDAARKKLQSAVVAVNQMGGENARLQDMQATAREVATAIKEAEKLIEKVASVAEAAIEEDLHKDDNARERQKKEVERFDRDVRRRRVDQLRQARNDWNRADSDAKNRENRAKQNTTNLKRQVDQLEKRLDKEKNENSRESLERQRKEVQKRVDDSERAREAAAETRQYAGERRKETDESRKKIERDKLEPLEKPNPAAELSKRLSDQAIEELADIRAQLGRVSKELDLNDDIRARSDQAKSLAKNQQRLTDEVADAAEALRRSARHEDRLDEESRRLEANGGKARRPSTPFRSRGRRAVGAGV